MRSVSHFEPPAYAPKGTENSFSDYPSHPACTLCRAAAEAVTATATGPMSEGQQRIDRVGDGLELLGQPHGLTVTVP